MSGPSSWVSAQWAHYGAVISGVLIGTAAKYGLTIGEGTAVTRRGLIADILLLGFDCLVALVICEWFRVTGVFVVLTAALAALASDRLVRLFRDRFIRGVAAEMSKFSSVISGPDVGIVPPGNEPPHHIQVIAPVSQSTPEVAIEHLHERELPLRDGDFDSLIERLDQVDRESRKPSGDKA